MLDCLDRKLGAFERRQAAISADGAVPSAADAERDARTLGTLVRLFERLRTVGSKAARAPATPQSAPAAPPTIAERVTDDTDSLRDALARRLETLRLGARA